MTIKHNQRLHWHFDFTLFQVSFAVVLEKILFLFFWSTNFHSDIKSIKRCCLTIPQISNLQPLNIILNV